MNYNRLRPAELTESQLAEWRVIQSLDPALASPYFSPEFTLAVAKVRKDVFITTIEEEGRLVGLFPHQRSALGFGKPVGGILSDYHGLIMKGKHTIDPESLLKTSRLVTWEFNHLPAGQVDFAPYVDVHSCSPIIDVSRGWESFCSELTGSGTQVIKKMEYCLRRLNKEVGPVRFSHSSCDENTLDALLRWKSEQYIRSGLVDIFAVPWTADLLRTLLRTRNEDFRGVLSEMRAGDRLIAVHFGMSTKSTWHWWFPAYDVVFSKYSPGMLLLMDAIQTACKQSISIIDLGKGQADYKDRLCNNTIPLVEGEAFIPSLRVKGRASINSAKDALRKSAIYPLLMRPLQWAGRMERRKKIK